MTRLIFFGTQAWAATLLHALAQDSFFEVVGVITQPDQAVGRKQQLEASPVKQEALRLGLQVFTPNNLKEEAFVEKLRSLRGEVSVVVAYGKLLPSTLVHLCPRGTVNVHPSLLPKWRGPSPVQAAIANGDTQSGISVMVIDTKMDHGPILAQEIIPIEETETFASFMQKVTQRAVILLPQTLKAYLKGEIVAFEQDHDQASVCRMLTREDGRVDWNQSAKAVERTFRAYQSWPGLWTLVNHKGAPMRLKFNRLVLSSKITQRTPGALYEYGGALFAATADGVLELLEVQPEGKAPMTSKAFLSGYRDVLEPSFFERPQPNDLKTQTQAKDSQVRSDG